MTTFKNYDGGGYVLLCCNLLQAFVFLLGAQTVNRKTSLKHVTSH